MRNIVISGATGFLGSNLSKKFVNSHDQVWAIVRPESKNAKVLDGTADRLQILMCALTDKAKIINTIRTAEAWFHFAWGGVNREEIDDPEVHKKNIEMSIDVLDTAHELGCKVFMDAGSRVEYGITDGVMREDMECHPVNAYGKAKLAFYKNASELCIRYKMKYCHLRFFSVYGFGDHPWSIISTLLRELPAGNKVSLSACQHEWNFMYIDDAIDAVYHLFLAVEVKDDFDSGIFNIASSDTRVLKSFVQEVYDITGREGTLEYGTFVQAKEGALSIIPSTKNLKYITDGWKESYTFERGIRETLRKGNQKDQ